MTARNAPIHIDRFGHQYSRSDYNVDFWFSENYEDFYKGKKKSYNMDWKERKKKTELNNKPKIKLEVVEENRK